MKRARPLDEVQAALDAIDGDIRRLEEPVNALRGKRAQLYREYEDIKLREARARALRASLGAVLYEAWVEQRGDDELVSLAIDHGGTEHCELVEVQLRFATSGRHFLVSVDGNCTPRVARPFYRDGQQWTIRDLWEAALEANRGDTIRAVFAVLLEVADEAASAPVGRHAVEEWLVDAGFAKDSNAETVSSAAAAGQ